uniref:GPS domain-containing protein n=2 Tax=Haemonchus contortus TaxID=6289 RepID=A0A912MH09_HAECO
MTNVGNMQSCMLLQSLLLFLYYYSPTLSSSLRQYHICNTGTDYECECSHCWDTVAPMESLDWVTVSLLDCPLRFNDTMIRKRIASWINEECNASFTCGLENQLNENHIVMGHYKCESDSNELRLIALHNCSVGLHQRNVLPAHLLGLVLQSREHLLSFLLHSEVLSATVHRRLKGTPASTTISNQTVFALLVALTVFAFFMLLLIYFSQIYVNWTRIVKGGWSHNDYRKAPHVQYTSGRITLNGQLCTRNY